jgi:branched-chain amino acid transport system permease protein
MNRPSAIGLLAAVAAAVIAPFVVNAYVTDLLAQACVYAVLAISLDLVWGYAGILDLGHAMWFGTGALVVGIMTTTVSPTGLVMASSGGPGTYLVAILAGTVAAGVMGAIVTWFASGSDGTSPFYLSIVTLALATALQTAYTQFPAVTGGENGLFGFAYVPLAGLPAYYLAVAVLALALAGAIVVVRSDFGLLMRAVRDHEGRVRYLGYDVRATKVVIFGSSAALAGFAGAIFGTLFGFVSAPLFGFAFSTEILIWVAVGGRATIVGPVLGAIVLSVVGSRLNERWPLQWPLLMGSLFVTVVVAAPAGILPPITSMFRRRRSGAGETRALTASPAVGRRARPDGRTAIATLHQIRFNYGALQVLRGIDLTIQRGELLCIVGPNGAGKSTLLNLLTDGRRGYDGRIDLSLARGRSQTRPDAEPVHHAGVPPHALVRAGLGRKFQTPALFPTLSLAETLIVAIGRGRWPAPWRRTMEVAVPAAVLRITDAAGLASHVNRPAGELAHGLKQGAELAVAVAARPELLLLDEPTAGLVANERETIGQILTHLVRDAGVTIVLIEHDLDFVLRLADRIAVLDDGRIVECGDPAAVAGSSAVRDAYLGVHA